jgi:hypothetical protein
LAAALQLQYDQELLQTDHRKPSARKSSSSWFKGYGSDDDDDDYQNDYKLALELQAMDVSAQQLVADQQQRETENDRMLAEMLQAELERDNEEQDEMDMMSTTKGKALKFVQAVLNVHKSLHDPTTVAGISTVAVDDLVWLVERMIVKQEEHQLKNISSLLDLGYHYTEAANLDRIRTDGLLTYKERTDRSIQSKYNGSVRGDGIYTCDDATTYRGQNYGPVGLLVARM